MIVQTGERGCDYAFGRPTPAALKAAGFSFVVRYISTPATNPKNLTPAERDQLLDAGLSLWLVWEVASTSPSQGAALGATHGAAAKAQARALGYPIDVPILVAVDTDTYLGNIDRHADYVRAFVAACVPYPIGVYGDADILARIGPLSKLGWLPNATGWSAPLARKQVIDAGLVHVQQGRGTTVDGIAVDPNIVIRPCPAWSRSTAPTPAPLPSPVPIPEEGPVVRVTFSGYANQFTHDGGSYSHISRELAVAYTNVPLLPPIDRSLPGGEAAFKAALHDNGLDESDLDRA